VISRSRIGRSGQADWTVYDQAGTDG